MKKFCFETVWPFLNPEFAFLAFLALLGAGLTGCSTQMLSNGTELAKVGQAASLQMDRNATLSAHAMLALKKAVAFNDGYNNAIGDPASRTYLANLAAIQSKLVQYGDWLECLASAYSALGDLAAYDAVGNFDSSIDTLATNTASFASAIGKPISIPPDATATVKVAGGLVLGSIQAHEVKSASRKIEILLTNVIAALDDPNTKKQIVCIQGDVAGFIDQAADVLFAEGICSYAPLLDDLGAPLGLRSVAKVDDVVANKQNVLAGLRNVARELANEQVASQAAAYDESVAALKSLVPLHEELRRDVPLNLTTIINITGQLQEMAAMFQPLQK
ncbi:MAG: hypothetical protein ABSH48_19860 [Verrucomicrobiota bacterium]|jgi:hypothetical protein